MASGRTRDENARERLLDAAFSLVSERASARVSVNEIVAAAQVGKQTIYRWWDSKSELILDALLDRTLQQTPFPDTDDPEADYRLHMREIVEMFNSPAGSVIKELLAEAQSDSVLAEQFVKRFWAPRRQLSAARLSRAVDSGQVRSDLEPDAVLDAMYGVLWTRLVLGHLPLRPEDVDDVVTAVWWGLARGAAH